MAGWVTHLLEMDLRPGVSEGEGPAWAVTPIHGPSAVPERIQREEKAELKRNIETDSDADAIQWQGAGGERKK